MVERMHETLKFVHLIAAEDATYLLKYCFCVSKQC